jgi:hypothetical protein
MVRFGGNEFTAVAVPLVFGGRYFIVEAGDPPFVSVVVEQGGALRFEVVKNEPGAAEGSGARKSPAGVVTVTTATGDFLYKVRPASETSVTFGRLRDEGELEVRITDARIKIVRHLPGDQTEDVLTAERNMFGASMAGIVVSEDGSIGMGAPIPPTIRAALGL